LSYRGPLENSAAVGEKGRTLAGGFAGNMTCSCEPDSLTKPHQAPARGARSVRDAKLRAVAGKGPGDHSQKKGCRIRGKWSRDERTRRRRDQLCLSYGGPRFESIFLHRRVISPQCWETVQPFGVHGLRAPGSFVRGIVGMAPWQRRVDFALTQMSREQ
jgi:hypothetical protein